MTRHAVQPTETENQSPIGGTSFTHDAYGTIRLTHPQGGSSTLFGSDIGHHNRVRIEICRARLDRLHGRDWVFPRETVVDVEMSHAQFAQFIMSSGKGDGTPCTLIVAPSPDTRVQAMPAIANIETKHATFKREIRDEAIKTVEFLEKQVDVLVSLVANGKPRISELKDISRSLKVTLSNLPSNMEFVVSSAEEALERATSDAKIEVEAYIAATAQRIGLNHISQLGQIEYKEKPNAE